MKCFCSIASRLIPVGFIMLASLGNAMAHPRAPQKASEVAAASLSSGYAGLSTGSPLLTFSAREPLINSPEEATAVAERLFAEVGRDVDVMLKSIDEDRSIFVDPIDSSAVFHYRASTGDFSFMKGLDEYREEEATPGLPTGDEAVSLARQYLEALNLMPADPSQLVLQHIGGRSLGVHEPDGTTRTFSKLTTITFGRQIQGYRVSGPGSKLIVHLGAYGELVGLTRRWTEVEVSKAARNSFASDGMVRERLATFARKEWSAAAYLTADKPQPAVFDDGHGRLEMVLALTAELGYEIPEMPEEHIDPQLGFVPLLRTSQADFRQQPPAAREPMADMIP